ncbi:MAG: hypothetical protein IRZ16_21875 [Myxococcaceae bacterium]|nr:hypothetical protein [Myxococcaceae bacterium]
MRSIFGPTAIGLVFLSAQSCSPPPTPPPPDPPRVTLTAPSPNVADTEVRLTLNITGCDELSQVEILEDGVFLQNVEFHGNPTTVHLAPNSFKYDHLAEDLSLVARAICIDGRKGSSTPASVRYLPVEELLHQPDGSQYVTDVFVAEGKDANVGFLGCSGGPNGTTAIVRVNRSGEVVAFNQTLPFNCTRAMRFTDVNLASGKRWAVEPGVGALALDPALNITAYVMGPVQALGVGPDGDAVVYVEGGGIEAFERVAHGNGEVKWTFPAPGVAIADPVIQSGFGVFAPVRLDDFGAMTVTVAVQRIDYANGVATTDDLSNLNVVSYQVGDLPPRPPAAFNPDGTILYTAYPQPGGTSVVLACASSVDGCSAGARKWTSPSLPGDVVALIPYANGSILAAVTPQFLWFLDTTTGFLINKGGQAISPQGALVTVGVQPGIGRDFYVLNGTGAPGTLPVEVIAIDDPAFGELFRYSVNGFSLMAGVDAGGRLWLRTGNDLALTLPLAEYQKVAVR